MVVRYWVGRGTHTLLLIRHLLRWSFSRLFKKNLWYKLDIVSHCDGISFFAFHVAKFTSNHKAPLLFKQRTKRQPKSTVRKTISSNPVSRLGLRFQKVARPYRYKTSYYLLSCLFICLHKQLKFTAETKMSDCFSEEKPTYITSSKMKTILQPFETQFAYTIIATF